MKFILIIWLYAGGIMTVEFDDELACEVAAAEVRKEAARNSLTPEVVRAVCVSRVRQ